jgi:hypothetical protein
LSDYHCLLKHFNLPSEALLEEYRLTVLENQVLRRIFGPNKEEVTKGKNLYSLPNIIGGDYIKEYEMGVICCLHGPVK